jgi:hypothetical protein
MAVNTVQGLADRRLRAAGRRAACGEADMLALFRGQGQDAPALEFLSPIKGPALEQITVEVGSGIRRLPTPQNSTTTMCASRPSSSASQLVANL